MIILILADSGSPPQLLQPHTVGNHNASKMSQEMFITYDSRAITGVNVPVKTKTAIEYCQLPGPSLHRRYQIDEGTGLFPDRRATLCNLQRARYSTNRSKGRQGPGSQNGAVGSLVTSRGHCSIPRARPLPCLVACLSCITSHARAQT